MPYDKKGPLFDTTLSAFLDKIKEETEGTTDAEKLATLKANDAIRYSRQARVTGERVLMGQEMVEEREQLTATMTCKEADAQIMETWGLRPRMVGYYRAAARAVCNLIALDLGEDTPDLDPPAALLDFPVSRVRWAIRLWAEGGDPWTEYYEICELRRAKEQPEDAPKPEPKPKTLKAWTSDGDKLLGTIPGEDTIAYQALIDHRDKTEAMIEDVECAGFASSLDAEQAWQRQLHSLMARAGKLATHYGIDSMERSLLSGAALAISQRVKVVYAAEIEKERAEHPSDESEPVSEPSKGGDTLSDCGIKFGPGKDDEVPEVAASEPQSDSDTVAAEVDQLLDEIGSDEESDSDDEDEAADSDQVIADFILDGESMEEN